MWRHKVTYVAHILLGFNVSKTELCDGGRGCTDGGNGDCGILMDTVLK